MDITQKKPGQLEIGGSITIHTVEHLYKELKKALLSAKAAKQIKLDLQKVDEIDTAGAQTLLAFTREVADKDIEIIPCDGECCARIKAAGFDSRLYTQEKN